MRGPSGGDGSGNGVHADAGSDAHVDARMGIVEMATAEGASATASARTSSAPSEPVGPPARRRAPVDEEAGGSVDEDVGDVGVAQVRRKRGESGWGGTSRVCDADPSARGRTTNLSSMPRRYGRRPTPPAERPAHRDATGKNTRGERCGGIPQGDGMPPRAASGVGGVPSVAGNEQVRAAAEHTRRSPERCICPPTANSLANGRAITPPRER